MVPGLENAEFFRYGVMHRNTFVDAPHVLDGTFAVPGTSVRLAGQITGTEGYMKPVATGLLAALNTYAEAIGAAGVELPRAGRPGRALGVCDRSGYGGLSAHARQLWSCAAARGR